MSKQIEQQNGTPESARTPKTTSARPVKSETVPPLKGFSRAVPILLCALAVFTMLCFFMENTGTMGRAIRTALYGLFSFGAYLIPFMLLIHAIFYAADTHKRRRLSRLLFSVLTLIFFCATVYCVENFGKEVAFLPKEYYARGMELHGGGLVGSAVAYAITKVFGSVGLIIIALMIVALYVTFFFSREGGTIIRFGLKVLTAIFTFFSKIEKALKYAFSPEERAKRRKAKATVQKQRELMEDDFFDVDDGLERLEIPALGITQQRDSRSQEENPMLHDRVIHEDGAARSGATLQSSVLEDVVSAQDYDAFVIDDIPRTYGATGANDRIYSAQAFPSEASASQGASASTARESATGRGGAYTAATTTEGTVGQASTPRREMNAEEAFGSDFDAFDIQRNQEILQRTARTGAQSTSPLYESIDSITPEEVERLRREQEFERRKASVLSQRENAQAPRTASPTPETGATAEQTRGATYGSGIESHRGATPTYRSEQTTAQSTDTPVASAAPEAEFLTPESYAHIAQIVRESEDIRPVDTLSQRGKVSTFTFGEAPTSRPLSTQSESFVLTIDKTPKPTPEATAEQTPGTPTKEAQATATSETLRSNIAEAPRATSSEAPRAMASEAPTSTVYRESESTVFIRGDKGKRPEEVAREEDPFRRIAEMIERGEQTSRVAEPSFTSVQRTHTETETSPKVAEATTAQPPSRPASEEASLIGAVLREFETEQGIDTTQSAFGRSTYYEEASSASLEVTREIIEEPVYEDEEETPLDFIDEEEEEDVTVAPEEDVSTPYIPPASQNPVISEQRNLFSFLRGTDPNSEPLPEGVTQSASAEERSEAQEAPVEVPKPMADTVESDDAPPFDGATRTSSRFAEYVSSMSRPEERPKPKEEPKEKPVVDYSQYQFPPIKLLKSAPPADDADAQMEINASAEKLIDTLASFRVQATVKGYDRGPRITRYEVVPARGVKVSAITNLFDDISLALAADGVRMEAPIPGKSAIGFEIPNRNPTNVYLRDLIESDEFMHSDSKTLVCMGQDVAGTPIYGDIAKMPHVLVAGATGMGKSVCINAMMLSILFRARPDEVKLIMIDPKKVEFQPYNGIPHLLVPVVIDPKQAAGALMWAVEEMEKRFDLIEQLRVKKIDDYNEKVSANPELGTPMPKIIIVIDELNDLMIQVRDPVENLIMRIAQKARAAGIHLIIGTQRPSVNVITGVIKANIPSRISCKVASSVDSRTILETAGAEKLLDRGDMLFFPVTRQKPLRVQGAYVSDTEVDSILDFLREQAHGEVGYDEEVLEQINRAASKCSKSKGGDRDSDDDDDDGAGEGFLNDPTFNDAVKVALHAGKISTSLLQRKLSLGFGRAAKYIDIMEDLGIVGEKNGQKPRDVLITMQEWEELLSRRSLD